MIAAWFCCARVGKVAETWLCDVGWLLMCFSVSKMTGHTVFSSLKARVAMRSGGGLTSVADRDVLMRADVVPECIHCFAMPVRCIW